MAKRIDPETAWAAYLHGHDVLRDWLAALPAPQWEGPSVLPGWSVADLAAHISTVADSVTALGPARRGTAADTVSDYLASYAPIADDIAERARTIVAVAHDPEKILAAVDERFAAAADAIDGLGLRDQVVTTRRVPVRLGDYLITRVIEIAVHADDLSRSVPDAEPAELPRDTMRMAVRALLEVLAERWPGRSVEVRIVPFAAIQCVEGPRHTRGTPPNVVEMAPSLWLRLAAGRTNWSAEVAAGTIVASGDRADLSSRLPLL